MLLPGVGWHLAGDGFLVLPLLSLETSKPAQMWPVGRGMRQILKSGINGIDFLAHKLSGIL